MVIFKGKLTQFWHRHFLHSYCSHISCFLGRFLLVEGALLEGSQMRCWLQMSQYCWDMVSAKIAGNWVLHLNSAWLFHPHQSLHCWAYDGNLRPGLRFCRSLFQILFLFQLKLNLTRAYFFAAFRWNNISANRSFFAYFQPFENKFFRLFVVRCLLVLLSVLIQAALSTA